jgi:hypothetical protein
MVRTMKENDGADQPAGSSWQSKQCRSAEAPSSSSGIIVFSLAFLMAGPRAARVIALQSRTPPADDASYKYGSV